MARATLGFERGVALGNHVAYSKHVEDLVATARAMGVADDTLVRDRVAEMFVQSEVFRHHVEDLAAQLNDGREPGSETSLTKLFWSTMEAEIFETTADILGPLAELREDAPSALAPARFHRNYWHARGSHIFAGTSEIQKNIIAERILGLPREETR